MLLETLRGQTVLVLGLGDSGLALSRWCVTSGAQVVVADTRAAPPMLPKLQAELPHAQFVSGVFSPELVAVHQPKAVFVSPGLAPTLTAPVLQAAYALGVWTGGELSVFAQALQALAQQRGYAPKVLAITGTNGKTTTTALTAALIARSGQTVAVAGNIGPTLLDTLTAHIQSDTLPQVWVLELSSFQLEYSEGFAPTAATVLNLSEDHLDWHGSMAAYAKAKGKIFGETTTRVLNRDDTQVMAYNTLKNKSHKPKYKTQTFGAAEPTQGGDWGLQQQGGMTWLVRAQNDGQGAMQGRKQIDDVYLQRLMPSDALRIRGRHNAMNALAALALASTVSPSVAPLLYGLREYLGEPHRVQLLGRVKDVEFYDDSKGTNVGATLAALQGLGAELAGSQKLLVLLGGDGKGQNFEPLLPALIHNARAVALIGKDAATLKALLDEPLQKSGIALTQHGSDTHALQNATHALIQAAQAGDKVLLSPACASLDMFKNYAHRAEVFVGVVAAHAEAHGEAFGDALAGPGGSV